MNSPHVYIFRYFKIISNAQFSFAITYQYVSFYINILRLAYWDLHITKTFYKFSQILRTHLGAIWEIRWCGWKDHNADFASCCKNVDAKTQNIAKMLMLRCRMLQECWFKFLGKKRDVIIFFFINSLIKFLSDSFRVI